MAFKPGLVCLLALGLQAKAKAAQGIMNIHTFTMWKHREPCASKYLNDHAPRDSVIMKFETCMLSQMDVVSSSTVQILMPEYSLLRLLAEIRAAN